MSTPHTVWISTDGQYYAVEAPDHHPMTPGYDILAVDGPGVWLTQRFQPKHSTETDLRYCYAETTGMIGSWKNKGRYTRGRTRYIEAFTIAFVDVRQDIPLSPWGDPAVMERETNPFGAHYEVAFRRRRRLTALAWTQLQLRIAQALAEGYGRLLDLAREQGKETTQKEKAWTHES